MTSHHLVTAVLFALPCGLFAQADAPAPAAPATNPAPMAAPAEASQALESKKQELTEVSQQIDQLQAQAEAREAVRASKDQYREAVRTEMVRVAPDKEKEINRQAELVVELTTTPAPAAATAAETAPADTAAQEREAKLAEYRQLRQQLLPVEQQVQEAEPVQTTRRAYFDTLIAEMERIDPKAPELLAKHRELTSLVRELSVQASRG